MARDKLLIDGTNACDDFEWEDITESLTSEMNRKNPSGMWEASVENFGWRSVSGTKPKFRADNGQDLLFKILPETDCHFKIFDIRRGFKINNAHHDKPMGGELYFILPACREGYSRDWSQGEHATCKVER